MPQKSAGLCIISALMLASALDGTTNLIQKIPAPLSAVAILFGVAGTHLKCYCRSNTSVSLELSSLDTFPHMSCANCGGKTSLTVSGFPICVKCAEASPEELKIRHALKSSTSTAAQLREFVAAFRCVRRRWCRT